MKQRNPLAIFLLVLLLCFQMGAPTALAANLETEIQSVLMDVEGVDTADILNMVTDLTSVDLKAVTRASIAYAVDFPSLEAALSDPELTILIIMADISMGKTLTIDHSMSIIGAPSATLRTSPESRHFLVEGDDVTIEFANVTLDGADLQGGGIESTASTLTLINAFIENCRQLRGGAVLAKEVNLVGGTLQYNVAGYDDWESNGGAVCAERVTVSGGAVINDNRAVNGGGISAEVVLIEDGNFHLNTADTGGAVYGREVTLMDGVISNNIASYGGGIATYGSGMGIVRIHGGIIAGNQAESGGGVYLRADSELFEMTGGSILENRAFENGGGVSADWVSDLSITGGEVRDNTAKDGGGLWLNIGQAFVDCLVTGNVATGDGGGIYVYQPEHSLKSLKVGSETVFSGNSASKGYYMVEPKDIELYEQQVYSATVSEPFTDYAYNNYDISYTRGIEIESRPKAYFYKTKTDPEPVEVKVGLPGTLLGELPAAEWDDNDFLGWVVEGPDGYEFISSDTILTETVNFYGAWVMN